MSVIIQLDDAQVAAYYDAKLSENAVRRDVLKMRMSRCQERRSALLKSRRRFVRFRRVVPPGVLIEEREIERLAAEISLLNHKEAEYHRMRRHFFDAERDAEKALNRYYALRRDIHDFCVGGAGV